MRLLKALLLAIGLLAVSAYTLNAGVKAPTPTCATPTSAVREVAMMDEGLDAPFVEEDSTLTAARGCKGCYG